jgi:CRP/FNR family transcriptional regulator, polysaccharide utilization system transcription regulator
MRKIQCEACPTRGAGAVCNVPAEVLGEFQAAGVTALYKPRQVIFHEGGPTTGLYLVCHGQVKLYHSDRFGRDHILEVAGAGAVLGEVPFNGDRGLSTSAEALTESQLCFLPRERLLGFLERHPAVAVRLLGELSYELASARRKVRDLALKGAESRLAGLLLQLAGAAGDVSSGKRLELRYGRRELAEMIGVSTETAIRLLAKLSKKRIIRLDRRDVVIADAEKLTKVANYDEAAA